MARPVNRGQKVQTVTLPAPTGGWNVKDALANMPPTDAVVMDNWFPETASVRVRSGYTNWSTGYPGAVNTVMAYKSGTASKLFAACGGGIYDATTQGVVGAAVASGFNSDKWQWTQMGTPGGQFLLCCNGVDAGIQKYDGTSWTTAAITGLPANPIINLNLHKARLWMIPKNSMSAYYLPVNSIGGAATQFDLSSLFRLGGYLVAMATWSIDGSYGAGMQENAVFISSEGEVAIYQGYDPAQITTWSLVGMFRIGRPIGNRCTCKFGSDLLLISADGLFTLSKALLVDRGTLQDAVSDKIMNQINSSVQAYANNFGWQVIVSPIDNQLLINVPVATGSQVQQYVMNTVTNAWCRFIGWNANCWELWGDSLYFGGSTYVAKANYGNSDNGQPIVAECKQAFSSFNGETHQKQFTMMRPLIQSDATINAAVGVNLDYADVAVTSIPTITPPVGASSYWNVSPWDTTPWYSGGSYTLQKNWQTVQGIGVSAAPRIKVTSLNSTIRWAATDLAFIPGIGVL